jgi:hypothetical protein
MASGARTRWRDPAAGLSARQRRLTGGGLQSGLDHSDHGPARLPDEALRLPPEAQSSTAEGPAAGNRRSEPRPAQCRRRPCSAESSRPRCSRLLAALSPRADGQPRMLCGSPGSRPSILGCGRLSLPSSCCSQSRSAPGACSRESLGLPWSGRLLQCLACHTSGSFCPDQHSTARGRPPVVLHRRWHPPDCGP